MLLEHGADVNSQKSTPFVPGVDGWTDVNARDHLGMTPFPFEKKNQKGFRGIMQLLLAHGSCGQWHLVIEGWDTQAVARRQSTDPHLTGPIT